MEKRSMQALNRLSPEDFKRVSKLPVVLVLDNVRSALNVGSVFRTADAFAVEKIVLCGITAQPPHREILKTALGSTETVDWEYGAGAIQMVQDLKTAGYRVFGVEQTTGSTWLQDFVPLPAEKYAFVFGNEVDGVADDVLRLCDGTLEIPQFGTKHSLNIAVAAGIVTWEVCKKIQSHQ